MHVCVRIFFLFLFQLQQRTAIVHLTDESLPDRKTVGIGDNHRCDDFISGGNNGITVKFNQRLTGCYPIPCGHHRTVMLAFPYPREP